MIIHLKKTVLVAILWDYARRRSANIDRETAAAVLDQLGSAYPCRRESAMIVRDADRRSVLFTSEEVRGAFRPYLQRLIRDLQAGVPVTAIRLTGYRLRGLDLLLREELGVSVEQV